VRGRGAARLNVAMSASSSGARPGPPCRQRRNIITKGSLPIKLSREGYLETIPQLIVEVKSKNDTQPEVDAKVGDYLKAGVWLVWVADPKTRTVMAHRAGQEPRLYTEDDVLTADDIIPGFRLARARSVSRTRLTAGFSPGPRLDALRSGGVQRLPSARS